MDMIFTVDVFDAGGVHAQQFGLLLGRELGLAAPESALGPRDGHALSGAHPQRVDLKLREGGKDVEEHLAHRIGRVVDLPAEGESDAAGC